MSVVAVKVNKDSIEIASDSILVRGDTKRTDSNFHKLTKINDFVVGAVGDAQEASLFMQFCEEHKLTSASEKAVLAFMCEFKTWQTKYIDPATIENDYILIVKKKVFAISGLFVEEVEDYDAIGAGQDFALAALYLGHSPQEAVQVACNLCCYVAEPIIRYKIEK